MPVHHPLRLVAFPTRTRAAQGLWSGVRSPGSRTRTVCTCQGLRPRGTGDALALTRTPVLSSAVTKASASRLIVSRLNGWPMRSPADASSPTSRPKTHGSGPVRIATPSPQWTCTTYSSPVFRRTVILTPVTLTKDDRPQARRLFSRRNCRAECSTSSLVRLQPLAPNAKYALAAYQIPLRRHR